MKEMGKGEKGINDSKENCESSSYSFEKPVTFSQSNSFIALMLFCLLVLLFVSSLQSTWTANLKARRRRRGGLLAWRDCIYSIDLSPNDNNNKHTATAHSM